MGREVPSLPVKLMTWLGRQKDPVSKLLVGGEDPVSQELPIDAIEKLQIKICRSVSPISEARRFLSELHAMMRESDHRELLRGMPMLAWSYAAREASPLGEDTVKAWRRRQRLRVTLIEAALKAGHSIEQQRGLALLSAIINGGIHDRAAVGALVVALHGGGTLPLATGRAYFHLSLSWLGREDQERRRWQPDPLTELLVYRYLAAVPELEEFPDPIAAAWASLTGTMHTFCGKSSAPTSLRDLLKLASDASAADMPTAVWKYDRRSTVSHSVKIHGWERLMGRPVTHVAAVSHVSEPDRIAEPAINLDDPTDPLWLKDLLQTLDGTDSSRSRERLAALVANRANSAGGCEQLVYQFCEKLLTSGSTAKKRLAPSTVRNYLGLIVRRLAPIAPLSSIARLSAASIEELYTSVLEADDIVLESGRGYRRKLARVLREFHHFLRRYHGAVSIDEHTALGAGLILYPVDANIISFDEIDCSVKLLQRRASHMGHGDVGEALALILELSFYCGMRRMEVLGLKLSDIHLGYPARMHIRPNEFRRLKTRNSLRSLPIQALLPTNVMARLVAWCEKRKSEEGEDAFVFGISALGIRLLPYRFIVDHIHWALRSGTGDPTVRFHHLRHSAATWTLLRYHYAFSGSAPWPFRHLPKTHAALTTSEEFVCHLMKGDSTGKKGLSAVSAILGHGSPKTSVEHYIHCLDIISSDLHEVSSKINRRKLIAIAGVPEKSGYRAMNAVDKGDGYGKFMAMAREHLLPTGCKHFQIIDPAQDANSKKANVNNSLPTALFGSLVEDKVERIRDALATYSWLDSSLEEISARTALDVDQVSSSIAAGMTLMDRLASLAGSERDPFETLGEKSGNRQARIPVLKAPREASDIEIVQRLFSCAPVLLKKPMLANAICSIYLDKVWHSNGAIVFSGPEERKDVRDFLSGLELMRNAGLSTELRIFDGAEKTLFPDKWRKALRLPEDHEFSKESRPNDKSKGYNSKLSVRILFERNGRRENSPAFRYFVLSLWVLLSSTSWLGGELNGA